MQAGCTPSSSGIQDLRSFELSADIQPNGLWPFFNGRLPWWKRSMDVLIALLSLIALSPMFALIGAIIKLSSSGPVFFRQSRIGRAGKPFEFIKFRSMSMNCSTHRHRQYLSELIGTDGCGADPARPMVKLDACNPDIFAFGRFLRISCLDELPQLINVLKGEMSLVGPRPPIPYEVENYCSWHNGRFDAVPGMTGLWQVSGKNRLSFQAMVRLDIRYSQHMTPMRDFVILLQTPLAILREALFAAKSQPTPRQGELS